MYNCIDQQLGYLVCSQTTLPGSTQSQADKFHKLININQHSIKTTVYRETGNKVKQPIGKMLRGDWKRGQFTRWSSCRIFSPLTSTTTVNKHMNIDS